MYARSYKLRRCHLQFQIDLLLDHNTPFLQKFDGPRPHTVQDLSMNSPKIPNRGQSDLFWGHDTPSPKVTSTDQVL